MTDRDIIKPKIIREDGSEVVMTGVVWVGNTPDQTLQMLGDQAHKICQDIDQYTALELHVLFKAMRSVSEEALPKASREAASVFCDRIERLAELMDRTNS